jgi:hypothetical protein
MFNLNSAPHRSEIQGAVTRQQPTFFSCSFYQTVLLVDIKTHKESHRSTQGTGDGVHHRTLLVTSTNIACKQHAVSRSDKDNPFRFSARGIVGVCNNSNNNNKNNNTYQYVIILIINITYRYVFQMNNNNNNTNKNTYQYVILVIIIVIIIISIILIVSTVTYILIK